MAYTFTKFPADKAKNVRPRTKAYMHALLDLRMLDVTVKINGVLVYTVAGGFASSYWSYILEVDAGLDLTVRLRPLDYWQSNTQYTIEVWWDDGVDEFTETWTFTTGVYCLEDDYPTVSTMDQAIMTGFATSQSDRLRRALMLVCSNSAEQFPQARTVIWLACMTELKTILAGVLDFDLAESVILCDRRSVVSIRADLRAYMSVARGAIDELKLKEDAKKLLRDYLDSASPIYAVNTMAAIVVLATRGLNL